MCQAWKDILIVVGTACSFLESYIKDSSEKVRRSQLKFTSRVCIYVKHMLEIDQTILLHVLIFVKTK